MDSNDYKLTCADIIAMSYLPGSFIITDGQSSKPPPTFTKNGSTWTVSIDANRKNSSAVADSFNQKTGGALHEYTNSSGDKSPKEMNFYFGVEATFLVNGNHVSVTFYIGQGHYTSNNNWWIGGNNILNKGGNPLFNVISNGTIVSTYDISGSGNYTMELTPVA
jgi:hypothetical protein